jgi:predicted NBD/HSP70 family sugar kinase
MSSGFRVKLVNQMSSVRATPPLLKDMNERTVLEAIRAASPISRAEISRRVGISKPTVSQALQSLLDAGLVRETEPDGAGPRYGATFFEPVAEAAYVLGLDLGARFVRGALADLDGAIRARQDVDLGRPDATTALVQIERLASSLLAAAGVGAEAVDGAVLGVPGAVQGREIRLATNVAGLEGDSFALELASRLPFGVTIENDINLAALGEQARGVARGVEDFAFISIGTGLGTGLVLRGELHRGHHGTAGELDYFRAGIAEELDPCAGAVSAHARELAEAKGASTVLAPPYEPREVFAAARAGDELARAVVAEEARRIALHIAPIASVADVRLIVLGGGIGANGDLLHGRVRALLAEWLPYPPRVEGSSLGDAAVLTGALSIALRTARENVFVNRTRA